MVANSLFGWLSIGLENAGGAHNGMNGGRVVMALPASPVDYSPRTGLNLRSSGPTVNEYVINEFGGSAFRLWQHVSPNASLATSAVEAGECYTSMAFTTHAIAGWSLNLTGALRPPPRARTSPPRAPR